MHNTRDVNFIGFYTENARENIDRHGTNGFGVEATIQDIQEALRWNCPSHSNPATLFQKGEKFLDKGGEKNIKSAIKKYFSAAEMGHAQAQYKLALIYDPLNSRPRWHGFKTDADYAIKWYKRAAKQNHPISAFRGSELCFEIDDYSSAYKLARKSEQLGGTDGRTNHAIRAFRSGQLTANRTGNVAHIRFSQPPYGSRR